MNLHVPIVRHVLPAFSLKNTDQLRMQLRKPRFAWYWEMRSAWHRVVWTVHSHLARISPKKRCRLRRASMIVASQFLCKSTAEEAERIMKGMRWYLGDLYGPASAEKVDPTEGMRPSRCVPRKHWSSANAMWAWRAWCRKWRRGDCVERGNHTCQAFPWGLIRPSAVAFPFGHQELLMETALV